VVESKIALRILGGWGVASAVLADWVDSLAGEFDVQLVEIPDLQVGEYLSPEERNRRLLQSAPAQAYWLGWSLGGAIALDLAAQVPTAVRGVITLGTNPCFVAREGWPGMDAKTFDAFSKAYQQDARKTLQRFAALQVSGANDPRTQLRLVRANLQPPEAVLADLLSLLALNRCKLVEQLEVPLLSILAADDALVPAKVAQKLAGLGSRVRAEIICSASHMLFQDQPLTLRESVRDWIELQEAKYAR